jgi:hypothetical protein
MIRDIASQLVFYAEIGIPLFIVTFIAVVLLGVALTFLEGWERSAGNSALRAKWSQDLREFSAALWAALWAAVWAIGWRVAASYFLFTVFCDVVRGIGVLFRGGQLCTWAGCF